MIAITTVITVQVLVSATTVDGSVIDNCFSVTAKGYFTTKRPCPGIYTIRDPCSTTTSGHTAQGYCDTLTDVEDG